VSVLSLKFHTVRPCASENSMTYKGSECVSDELTRGTLTPGKSDTYVCMRRQFSS
jgi:hypothetical protein